ncbi:MAG: helix-turn-helix domain-containing protein [Propionibacteriaceae bacterium]|jgi:HTH-type transcriptional regulator/antitoxin HipB|nr:helix-turn-helix domain-containing protein [Propionibacteriaceae bacterium]
MIPIRDIAELGGLVSQARHDAGLTQEQLATRVGVSRKWLGRLENGQNSGAEFTLIARTLRALGIRLVAEATEATS